MMYKETETRKLKYVVTIILVILVCVGIFGQFVKGEMLPERSLKIYVEGMDTVDYWLDLLVNDSDINYKRTVGDTVESIVENLIEYQDNEGYHPAMLSGSEEEFIGGFEGYIVEDGSIRHEFWGEGLPKQFKIIIQTRDGKLIVSDLIKIRGYHSKVRFDIGEIDRNKEINASIGNVTEIFPWMSILLIFFVRLFAAFLIKLTIIEAFGIKSSKPEGLAIKTIISTQLVLCILLVSQVILGGQTALIIFFIASIAILVAECIIYLSYIKEYNVKTKILAAVVSNLASALVGYFLIFFIEWIS